MIKPFLFKIFFLSVPFLVFFVYSEIGLNKIPTSYSVLKENFKKKEKEINVLVVGSSESQLGIAPKYFSKFLGYNLSNSSQSIYSSCQIIENNLGTLENLKLVILSINPAIFFQSNQNNIEQWREKYYYHYWGINPEYDHPNLIWKFKIGIYEPKTTLFYALHNFKNYSNLNLNNLDSLGWEKGFSNTPNGLLNYSNGKKILAMQLKYIDTNYTNKNTQYIIELNNKLKKKKIKLLLIQLPLSKYYSKYLPTNLIQRNYKLIDSLSLFECIPNFISSRDSKYIDADFRDPNHLNYIGAIKFTDTLNKIIQTTLN